VRVEVYDKPNIILDYGLRYRAQTSEVTSRSSQTSATEGFELALRARYLQPFHNGGTASFSFFPQRDRDVARLRYDRPVFFGKRILSSAFLEVREDRRPEFDFHVQSESLTLRQSKELFADARRANPDRPRFELQWGAQVQESLVRPGPDAVEVPELPFNETFLRSQLSVSLIADGRDTYIDPTRGTLWSLSTQGGSQWIGSDFDFLRFYGEAAWYKTLAGRDSPWVWASGLKVGAILTQQTFPFIEDRFTAGGAYSVRGFPTRGLGPQVNGEPVGGRSVTIFHQELRFPLRGILRGGVFVDVGTVFDKPASFTADELRRSAGLGLRATLPFGVLRVDWATPLDRQPGESKGRFHIAFGHAF
jgi:outer membrane protein assembly factor BamA